ncbi:DUF4911 domain-containing protein [Synergistaceae bacterium OttesenSCG-928-I11]|nr:DUF4911 domain-containing protein [Synergistaceae bacterium OttesenSCG-928-I11]
MTASPLCYSLTIPREDICYVSWTFDAYEGVGLLRTDDARNGAVSLLFSSDYRDEAERILDALVAEGITIGRVALTEGDAI